MKDTVVHPASEQNLQTAADILRSGGLVAFPTETVYGLGGDATNDHAIAAIYEAKGRPQFNPLIIHASDPDEAQAYADWNPFAEKLAALFWPGPLTMVLKRRQDSPISLLASAGLDTLALRCPAHPIARDLIRTVGRPLAAPSANASGKLSPTQAEHVAESLSGRISYIIDGGPCRVGVESTVIDLTTDHPTLLRHGGLAAEEIEKALSLPLREALTDETAPKSPGMLLSHYAPHLPIRINVRQAHENEAFLVFGDDRALTGGTVRANLSPTGDLVDAAANLFAMLRQLDKPTYTGIAVAPIPMCGLGAAINDRLRRAACS